MFSWSSKIVLLLACIVTALVRCEPQSFVVRGIVDCEDSFLSHIEVLLIDKHGSVLKSSSLTRTKYFELRSAVKGYSVKLLVTAKLPAAVDPSSVQQIVLPADVTVVESVKLSVKLKTEVTQDGEGSFRAGLLRLSTYSLNSKHDSSSWQSTLLTIGFIVLIWAFKHHMLTAIELGMQGPRRQVQYMAKTR